MKGHISAFPSAWVARYHNIPLFPARSSLPDYDGDMIWLRQTAQQIIAEVSVGPMRLRVSPSDRWFYNLTVDHLGYNPRHLRDYWPADAAEELVKQWKAELLEAWMDQR